MDSFNWSSAVFGPVIYTLHETTQLGFPEHSAVTQHLRFLRTFLLGF